MDIGLVQGIKVNEDVECLEIHVTTVQDESLLQLPSNLEWPATSVSKAMHVSLDCRCGAATDNNNTAVIAILELKKNEWIIYESKITSQMCLHCNQFYI